MVMLKVAAGSDEIRKYPDSEVSTVRSKPVLELLIVTMALFTTAPFGSVTVPSIALVNWARTMEKVRVNANKTLTNLDSDLTRLSLIRRSFLCLEAPKQRSRVQQGKPRQRQLLQIAKLFHQSDFPISSTILRISARSEHRLEIKHDLRHCVLYTFRID